MLAIFQIIVSVLLAGAILLQQKGTGLSATFGGGDGNVYRTRRGLERIIFYVTIVLIALLLGSAILNIIV